MRWPRPLMAACHSAGDPRKMAPCLTARGITRMDAPIAHRRRAALAALTALVVALQPACYNWHTSEVGPTEYLGTERPDVVRVTLADGSVVQIEDPHVIGESITGVLPPQGRGREMEPLPVTVPAGAVRTMEVRELSAPRTAIAAAVVAVGAVAIVVGVLSNRTHGRGCSPTGC